MIASSLRRSGLMFAVLLLASAFAPPLYAQHTSLTGNLRVHVDGLDGNEGAVRVALNNKKNYDAEGNVRAASLSIEAGTAQWTAKDLPHGTYAVRVHHDANGNGELDTNMVGVPQEAFGFSNNVRGTFGPPDFEEAAFTLASDSRLITITAE